uniref:Uncharacterized protein n=1 Tax=Timema shepardi TaxID=629360 RepID=A0A7R9FXR7_TIMSH|nr:unnamed protein product [Timema shepardi]
MGVDTSLLTLSNGCLHIPFDVVKWVSTHACWRCKTHVDSCLLNWSKRVLTSCDVTTTCDNKRGVSLAGWTTPTGRQTPPPAASWR